MKNQTVVVGSRAMAYHFPDFYRVPHDTDVVVMREDYYKAVNFNNGEDIDTIMSGEHSSIVKYKELGYIEYLFADDVPSLMSLLESGLGSTNGYATPEVLYSLKKAHINYPIKFKKHIADLMFLREKLRQKFNIDLETDLNSQMDWLDTLPTFTALHKKATEDRLGAVRTPKMKQSKEQFFGKSKNYVTSYYVHDDMHKAIALMHEGDPVYEKILAEGKEVETDSALWAKLTLQQKIWCVLEEVYVIALERKVIPPMFDNVSGMTDKEAFDWALYRVCTTLCDGFFRDFAVKAYDEIQKQYNPDYVKLFFQNIRQYDTNYDKTESEAD